MLDPKDLRDDDLVRRGRVALRDCKYKLANDLFAEYCDRQIRDEKPIAGALLADYALAVGHMGDLREAAEICLQGLAHERKNPALFAALARVYHLSGARRKAVDTLDRGLAIAPNHPGLLAVQDELGIRRTPPIPFLPRDNPWNVWLGKVLDKFKPRRRLA